MQGLVWQSVAWGLAVGALIVVTITVNRYGIRPCLASGQAPPEGRLSKWIARLEFTAQQLGGFSYRQLVLISVVGLFLELLSIRWISSEISVLAYFKNVVLIACFLGFGLGCYLSRRPINAVVMLVPLLALTLTCTLPWRPLRNVVDYLLPNMIGASSQLGAPTLSFGPRALSLLLGGLLFIVPVFSLVAFTFVPVGQLVGWLLENSGNGVLAYTVNILGSLAGIAIYTALCFLFLPPPVWFLIAGALMVAVLWKAPLVRWVTLAAFVICLLLTGQRPPGRGTRVYWSPYQKLTVSPIRYKGETVSYLIRTNGSWYQQIVDLAPAFIKAHPHYFDGATVAWNPYNLPYHFYPHPPSVLVLGAGTGNDVAAALRNGAGWVVAVEIDPLILKLGEQLHFEKPYSSPRVHIVLNDARSYVQNTKDRFDLIVFSLLDSHTTSSYYSNIRIDNYVYTVQALRETKRLLKPGGLMVLKFWVETPWIAGRLRELMQTTFGRPPLEVETPSSAHAQGGGFFISGSQRRIKQALSDPRLAKYVEEHGNLKSEPAPLTTDDWPYFYQREPGLPPSVVILSIVLITLTGLFLREVGIEARSLRWHFFFLGAGFLLLEAQIISKMALLFGTTWVVNSIVIAGLLVLIVASNLIVEWKPRIPTALAYLGIFGTILAAYCIPLEDFFLASIWIKALSATTVLCLPVFFAGIVFIQSFAAEGFRGEALGSNLFGALVGGLLESLSMWTGIHSLLIVAAIFYAASWVALAMQKPFAASKARIEVNL